MTLSRKVWIAASIFGLLLVTLIFFLREGVDLKRREVEQNRLELRFQQLEARVDQLEKQQRSTLQGVEDAAVGDYPLGGRAPTPMPLLHSRDAPGVPSK